MLKKIKIFEFKKNVYMDLDKSPEAFCNVIKCGKNRFTLRDFKLQDGHDDSIPYSAILCLNDKSLCKCVNDGCGGQTEMVPVDIRAKAIMASAMVKLQNYGWCSKGMNIDLDLNFIADTLAIGKRAELVK